MTDSHCHIAGEEFAADLPAVVERARQAGVRRALVILAAEDDAEIARAATVRAAWPDCRFAVGVHPHRAHVFASDPAGAPARGARRRAEGPLVGAGGENGLDDQYQLKPPALHQPVFRVQLDLARARNLPVVIHTREADEDTLRMLHEAGQAGLTGVFHCFSGDAAAAARALATGFHLSIPGIVTFPKAVSLRDAVPAIPGDRLLVETDSPYLAPVPHRGKRNEPAHVAKVVETLSARLGTTVAALSEQTDANFDALFRP